MPALPPERAGCRQPGRPGPATPAPRNPRPAGPEPCSPKPTCPKPTRPMPLPDPAGVRLCPIPDPSPPLDDVAAGAAPQREPTRFWAASQDWAVPQNGEEPPDCAGPRWQGPQDRGGPQ